MILEIKVRCSNLTTQYLLSTYIFYSLFLIVFGKDSLDWFTSWYHFRGTFSRPGLFSNLFWKFQLYNSHDVDPMGVVHSFDVYFSSSGVFRHCNLDSLGTQYTIIPCESFFGLYNCVFCEYINSIFFFSIMSQHLDYIIDH